MIQSNQHNEDYSQDWFITLKTTMNDFLLSLKTQARGKCPGRTTFESTGLAKGYPQIYSEPCVWHY